MGRQIAYLSGLLGGGGWGVTVCDNISLGGVCPAEEESRCSAPSASGSIANSSRPVSDRCCTRCGADK